MRAKSSTSSISSTWIWREERRSQEGAAEHLSYSHARPRSAATDAAADRDGGVAMAVGCDRGGARLSHASPALTHTCHPPRAAAERAPLHVSDVHPILARLRAAAPSTRRIPRAPPAGASPRAGLEPPPWRAGSWTPSWNFVTLCHKSRFTKVEHRFVKLCPSHLDGVGTEQKPNQQNLITHTNVCPPPARLPSFPRAAAALHRSHILRKEHHLPAQHGAHDQVGCAPP